MKTETVMTLIDFLMREIPAVTGAIKALQNHSGKPVEQMSNAEMIAAVWAFRIKTPEELIAEGCKEP